MAQVVKLKRTSVQGRIPTISNLELGELAINTHDGRIFFEKDNGELSIQEILTTNSSNSGSFNLQGDISASSLNISGNATIDGNLVLGGNITIGDASSDTIAFAGDISSSLIPDVNNAFDLGSTTRKFANVFAGTITADEFVGNISASSLGGDLEVDGNVLFNVNETHNFLDLDYDTSEHANSTAIGARQSLYVFLDTNNSGTNNQFGIYNNITTTDDPTDSDAIFLVTEEGDVVANSFSGSFVGDGSGLTNVITEVSEQNSVTASFSNQEQIQVTHNFDSRNIHVSVYDNSHELIIPESVTLTTTDTVDIDLSAPGSGYVVVAKGGHLLDGVYVDNVTKVSDTFTNQTSYTVNHLFGTKDVIATVYDTNDAQIIPQSIVTSTLDAVEIGFENPTSGRVVVVKAGHVVSGSMPFNNITEVPTLVSSSDQVTASLDSRYVETSEVTGSNVVGSDTITSIQTMTSAAYGAITPETNVLYIITD